jgi:hypothetical protein
MARILAAFTLLHKMTKAIAMAAFGLICLASAAQSQENPAVAALRASVAKCQAYAEAYASRPKIRAPNATTPTFTKVQMMRSSITFDVQTTSSLVSPLLGLVDVDIWTAFVPGQSEELAAAAVAEPGSESNHSTDHMKFAWQSGKWVPMQGWTSDLRFRFKPATEFSRPDRFATDDSTMVGDSVTAKCARIIAGRPDD